MKLLELLKDLEDIEISGDINTEINGIAYDSRKINPEDLFVCIKGLKTDGHVYIDNAIEFGANTIVVEDPMEQIPGVVIVKVKNSRIALATIAARFYGRPTETMNVIGVTGTNGKTTITHIIKGILEMNGVSSGLIGTISHKILDREYKASNTTPESLELQKLFCEMKASKVDTCVMEVSSHSLEMNRVKGIKFNTGVFTNLTPDHMDFHGNIESYKEAKTKLFYQTTDANIINIDDKYGKVIAKEIKELNTALITYGIKEKADIYAENINITPKGSSFRVTTPKFTGELFFSTPGLFSVYNALAALSVCYSLGYNFEQIKHGIESIKGVPGRFELVQNYKNRTIVVDYAHTPDALENVLNTIKEFKIGRIITVFGCGGDRDKTKRPLMGEIVSRLSDYYIITSDNPRTECPETIIKDIKKGINEGEDKYRMIIDRKEAIKEAIRISEPQDVVLIAGKGHETYQIIGDKVIDFDDKKIAQDAVMEEIE